MAETIEEQLQALRNTLEGLKASGSTINIISGEGGGSSSCLVKSTKAGRSYELKVYSNDLDGANDAVDKAIDQSKVLDKAGQSDRVVNNE